MLACVSEYDDGGAEDASGGTAPGKRLPAATEGHDVQRKDQGTHREIHPGNGVAQNQESGN